MLVVLDKRAIGARGEIVCARKRERVKNREREAISSTGSTNSTSRYAGRDSCTASSTSSK